MSERRIPGHLTSAAGLPAAGTRARRSALSVPASNERFIAKAAASDADEVILDLEDGVAPAARPRARANVVEALTTLDWGSRVRAVRINDVRTAWCYQDLIAVVEGAGAYLDTVILPKVNRPEDVYVLDVLLGQIEQAKGIGRRIGIEAQIETAAGMANAEAIARSSERLQALIFGPGDFAASLGMPTLQIGGLQAGYPGHIWHAALSRIVVAAKAAGIEAIDGPYGAYQDLDGLRQSAELARQLGCDGKWAIHPTQIAPINRIFSPTPEEIAHAQAIVERYQRSLQVEQQGALGLHGDLIDAASLRMAQRALARSGTPHPGDMEEES